MENYPEFKNYEETLETSSRTNCNKVLVIQRRGREVTEWKKNDNKIDKCISINIQKSN